MNNETSLERFPEDSIDEYKNELYILINYSTQIKNFKWPKLNYFDIWTGGICQYENIKIYWADMSNEFIDWLMSVLKRTIEIEKILINDNTTIPPLLRSSISICNTLITNDPTDGYYIKLLMRNRELLYNSFCIYARLSLKLFEKLNANTREFDCSISEIMYDDDSINYAIKIEKGKIKNLDKHFSQTNTAIEKELSSTENSKRIEDLKTLESIKITLESFNSEINPIKDNFKIIINLWSFAFDYFKSTIETLRSIYSTTTQDWAIVINKLNDILISWNALIDIMNKIQIQFSNIL
ncbi:hypothetical protein [Clostridium sp. HBUAS56017]|uniref:hypothetical protein n=1 Tax=Clostridium sp. HBUAS56017 TaxID=2571128 RepID=UPI001177F709|nr:hypothetical protein [Clostridium sp. HBUAS56017]